MNELDLHLTRRQLFGLTARGIGAAALGALLRDDLFAMAGPPARHCRISRRRRSG